MRSHHFGFSLFYHAPRRSCAPSSLPTRPPAALGLACTNYAPRSVSRHRACAWLVPALCGALLRLRRSRSRRAPIRTTADQRPVGRSAPVKRHSAIPVPPASRQQPHEPKCPSPDPPNSRGRSYAPALHRTCSATAGLDQAILIVLEHFLTFSSTLFLSPLKAKAALFLSRARKLARVPLFPSAEPHARG